MVTVKRENKQVICGVYCIRNIINNKRYIGSAKDIYGRWTTHIRQLENGKHDNQHLQNSWNKYGKDNFEFTILEICDPNIRFDIEQKYYEIYQAYDEKLGYNESKIARCPENDFTIDDIKNGKSVITYDQFIQLIDLLTNTNIPLTEVGKIVGLGKNMVCNIFYKNQYKKLLQDCIFQPRSRFINSKLTSEQVKEIIEKLKSGVHPFDISKEYHVSEKAIFFIKDHKAWKQLTEGIEFPALSKKRFSHNHTCVTQYDLNGNKINSYPSATVASEEIGVSCSSISQSCLGKVISSGGYIWRYDNDPFDKFPTIGKTVTPPSKIKPTPVDQYKNGIFIRTFKSIFEAKKVTGAQNIEKVLNGKQKHSGGFEWKRHIDEIEN